MTESLRSLVAPKTEIEASNKIYAVASFYPRFVRVYIPNEPYDKLQAGMEARRKPIRTKMGSDQVFEDNFERSIRRTKKLIRDYVWYNEFELFATFTFKEDRQNAEKCKTKIFNWTKNQQKRVGKFEYLIVPEFHKDKASLHFHALIKGYRGKLKDAINPHNDQPLTEDGRQVYSFSSYRSGFSNAKKINNTLEDHERVGKYVRKYITKDMRLFFGQNRYYASRGLKLPPAQDNPPTWYLHTLPHSFHSTAHGVLLTYLNSSVPASELKAVTVDSPSLLRLPKEA